MPLTARDFPATELPSPLLQAPSIILDLSHRLPAGSFVAPFSVAATKGVRVRGGYAFVRTAGKLFKKNRWHLQALSSKVSHLAGAGTPCFRATLLNASSTVLAFNTSAQMLVLLKDGCVQLTSAITGLALMNLGTTITSSTSFGPGDFLFCEHAVIFKRHGVADAGVYAVELRCDSLLQPTPPCYKILPTPNVSLEWLDGCNESFLAVPHNSQCAFPFNIKDNIGRGAVWIMAPPVIWAPHNEHKQFRASWAAAINECSISRDLIGALMGDAVAHGQTIEPHVFKAAELFQCSPGKRTVAHCCEHTLFVFEARQSCKSTFMQTFNVSGSQLKLGLSSGHFPEIDLASVHVAPIWAGAYRPTDYVIAAQLPSSTKGIVFVYTCKNGQHWLSAPTEVPCAPNILVSAPGKLILSDFFSATIK